jgi:hypothetical protein
MERPHFVSPRVLTSKLQDISRLHLVMGFTLKLNGAILFWFMLIQ